MCPPIIAGVLSVQARDSKLNTIKMRPLELEMAISVFQRMRRSGTNCNRIQN